MNNISYDRDRWGNWDWPTNVTGCKPTIYNMLINIIIQALDCVPVPCLVACINNFYRIIGNVWISPRRRRWRPSFRSGLMTHHPPPLCRCSVMVGYHATRWQCNADNIHRSDKLIFRTRILHTTKLNTLCTVVLVGDRGSAPADDDDDDDNLEECTLNPGQ